jgi:hypothetical protein
MQRQLYEYNKNQQIPVDSLIKIGETVLSFIVALFATKRSKDKRLDDLEITVKYILKKLEDDNNSRI